jgi:hypothetical protein
MINLTISCMILSLAAEDAPASPSSSPEQPTSAPVRRMVCGPYPQWVCRQWTIRDGLPDERVERISVDSQGCVSCRTAKGAVVLDGDRWVAAGDAPQFPAKADAPKDLPGVVPWLPVTCFAQVVTGQPWVGTSRGLCRWDGSRWRVYCGRRWLPNDHVNDVAPAPDGSAWVATDGGVSRIFTRRMTLAEKADFFDKEIGKYHNWRGLIKEISLPAPGRLEGFRQPSSDNDGLWTSLYVGAECFRYAATRSPEAKANATESMKAMLFLQEVTGMPGFVARSYLPRGEGARHGDGIWYPSKDPNWDFKGDTSSDEMDGHFFAYALYYELVDDEVVRLRIVDTARRVMDGIIAGGYYLRNPEGKPTRWGVWAPEKLNESPRWWAERGLNSLEILAYLKAAEYVTGDRKYHEAARELIDKHGYAKNTVYQKINVPPEINHSDDEMAFMMYYILLRYEKDPELRRVYLKSLERSWKIEQPEVSPFFNFVYGSATTGGFDLAESVEWLRDVPLDTVRWGVNNSGRRDVKMASFRTRFRRQQAATLLPISERPVMRWNGNPYEISSGETGHSKLDGTFWLLPYWMGRYHGFIVE